MVHDIIEISKENLVDEDHYVSLTVNPFSEELRVRQEKAFYMQIGKGDKRQYDTIDRKSRYGKSVHASAPVHEESNHRYYIKVNMNYKYLDKLIFIVLDISSPLKLT